MSTVAHPSRLAANFSELGQLSKLALPIVFTQLAQMGMSVADTVMAGRVSSVELAGVADVDHAVNHVAGQAGELEYTYTTNVANSSEYFVSMKRTFY